jgi:hypothetical protein
MLYQVDFKEALFEASLSHIPTAAKYFGVHITTINRWLKQGAPAIAWRALELRVGLDSHWPGYRITGQHIFRHDGYTFTRQHLDNWENNDLVARRNAYELGIEVGLGRREPQMELFK